MRCAEHVAEPFQSGQVWGSRHHLQDPPLDEQLGLEHHRLSTLTDGHPAAAAEQKSQIRTDQNPTRGTAMNLELVG
jgi:hypothetical protein